MAKVSREEGTGSMKGLELEVPSPGPPARPPGKPGLAAVTPGAPGEVVFKVWESSDPSPDGDLHNLCPSPDSDWLHLR